MPTTTTIIKFILKIVDNKINCKYDSTHTVTPQTQMITNTNKIKIKKDIKIESQNLKHKERIIKVTSINDILGSKICSDLEYIDETVCISYNKYLLK